MGELANQIVFYCLAAAIVTSSILAVTVRSMMRAATFLLVVLLCTAGFYLMLNYHFLAMVQISIYAGGILILFIFAILLTKSRGDRNEPADIRRVISGLTASVAGVAVTIWIIFKHNFLFRPNDTILGDAEINMKNIGHALMGTGKYQYLFSFEALGILLLACAIGGILIARKR